MSEELKRGIPKAIQAGDRIIYTEEEEQRIKREFERILKAEGAMLPDESLDDWEREENTR